jgi:hypothetical protein
MPGGACSSFNAPLLKQKNSPVREKKLPVKFLLIPSRIRQPRPAAELANGGLRFSPMPERAP